MERLLASLPKAPGTTRKAAASEDTSTANQSSSADGTSLLLGDPPLPADASEADTIKIYEEWANASRFEYCDLTVKSVAPQKTGVVLDETPSYMSVFSSEAKMLAHADIPKRSLAIAKEVRLMAQLFKREAC